MAESEVQAEPGIPNAAPEVATTEAEPVASDFPISKEGRRQAIILLLGVASIWIFALWTLITILQDGVSGVEWVTGLLMLGILVVAPAVAWSLFEEANARISAGDSGIRYRTVAGIDLTYPWADLLGFKPRNGKGNIARFFLGDNGEGGTTGDKATIETTPNIKEEEGDSEDEQEPETLLVAVRNDHTDQISNPLVRFLHQQAHGKSLPIYGDLENRDQLVSLIKTHLQNAA